MPPRCLSYRSALWSRVDRSEASSSRASHLLLVFFANMSEDSVYIHFIEQPSPETGLWEIFVSVANSDGNRSKVDIKNGTPLLNSTIEFRCVVCSDFFREYPSYFPGYYSFSWFPHIYTNQRKMLITVIISHNRSKGKSSSRAVCRFANDIQRNVHTAVEKGETRTLRRLRQCH